MLDQIRAELVSALKADDGLVRLNEEARVQSLREKGEDAQKKLRKRVAKLLKLSGTSIEEVAGSSSSGGADRTAKPRPPRPKPVPIMPNEPPTFIRFKWEQGQPIPFFPGRRRYVRIETDANSSYHNADDPSRSRINIVVGGHLKVFGTSPLTGGRMRIGLEGLNDAVVGSSGSIQVELYRTGLPAIGDQRDYLIVDTPKPKDGTQKSTFPEFEVIRVSGPDDELWDYISSKTDDVDINKHASNSEMNAGKLYVYYSEAYPRFANELKRLEQQNDANADLFRTRYETWLVVHALIMQDEAETLLVEGVSEDAQEEMLRQERGRLATVSAIMASQEVMAGASTDDDDDAG